jgi:hypothetical protein
MMSFFHLSQVSEAALTHEKNFKIFYKYFAICAFVDVLPRGKKQTSVLLCTSSYFSVLLCTSSYFSVLLCTSSYFSVLLGTSLYFFVLLCTSLYFSVLLRTSLHFTILLWEYVKSFSLKNRTKMFCYWEQSF